MQYVLGGLGCIFVYLKLTAQIDWSWWYVTLPFWGGAAFVLIFMGITAVLALAAVAINGK